MNKIELEEVKKEDIREMKEEWRNKKKSERLIDILKKINSCFND